MTIKKRTDPICVLGTMWVLAVSLLISLALAEPAAAQYEGPPLPAAAKPIWAVEEEWRDASLRGDRAIMERILTPGFIRTDAGQVQDRAAYLAIFRGTPNVREAKDREVKVNITGSTAVVTGIRRLVSANDGRTREVRFTHTFVRDGGRWKLAAAHNSPLSDLPRAAPSDTVWVIENRIRPDGRQQFEQFLDQFWGAALGDRGRGVLTPLELQTFRSTRVLRPAQPNADGTYSYFFVMDPLLRGADYSIQNLLRRMYPEEEASRIDRLRSSVMAGPQISHRLIQTRY